MTIVCLGDSLTYGYGVPPQDCWVSLLKNETKLPIINKGINGDTTSSLLFRSDEDLIDINPDYFILLIGTNDLLMGTDVHRVLDNTCFLLSSALENHITPIVLSPPVIYSSMAECRWSSFIDYNTVNKNLFLLGKLLREFCNSIKLQFINLYEVFDKHTDDFDVLYADGIHLNSKGHNLIYEELIKLKIFSS